MQQGKHLDMDTVEYLVLTALMAYEEEKVCLVLLGNKVIQDYQVFEVSLKHLREIWTTL